MPHPSFLSAWNFVWSQIWKLTLGLGINLRRVDIIIVMVHSTLPGWHTPLIEVEIASDFTKSYASMVSGQTFKWYGNRSDEIVAREFKKASCCPRPCSRAFDCPKTQSKMVHQYGVKSCLLLFNTTTTFQTGYISVETIWISQYGITYIIWLSTLNVEFF